MTPDTLTARPAVRRRPGGLAPARCIEFEEIDDDAADERALIRLIESQGALSVDAWSFDPD